ncbi:MAG: hypothetical protein Q8Q73_03130 [Stagnimonas sp.]|nr:hypothetical protein [Stagnimonas sp.]
MPVGRWLAVGFAGALLLAGLLQTASSLYYGLADFSRRADDLRRADAAARIAAWLLPGSDRATALAGRLAAAAGDRPFLLTSYREVLREAPADAYRWSELARGLALSGRLDADFDLAVARALALAPHSPAVHGTLADLAWRYHLRLSPQQQETLLPSLRATMRARSERFRLLEAVVRERRHPAFCAEFAVPLNRQAWCGQVEAELARCARPQKLKAVQRRWCGRMGALP